MMLKGTRSNAYVTVDTTLPPVGAIVSRSVKYDVQIPYKGVLRLRRPDEMSSDPDRIVASGSYLELRTALRDLRRDVTNALEALESMENGKPGNQEPMER